MSFAPMSRWPPLFISFVLFSFSPSTLATKRFPHRRETLRSPIPHKHFATLIRKKNLHRPPWRQCRSKHVQTTHSSRLSLSNSTTTYRYSPKLLAYTTHSNNCMLFLFLQHRASQNWTQFSKLTNKMQLISCLSALSLSLSRKRSVTQTALHYEASYKAY